MGEGEELPTSRVDMTFFCNSQTCVEPGSIAHNPPNCTQSRACRADLSVLSVQRLLSYRKTYRRPWKIILGCYHPQNSSGGNCTVAVSPSQIDRSMRAQRLLRPSPSLLVRPQTNRRQYRGCYLALNAALILCFEGPDSGLVLPKQ